MIWDILEAKVVDAGLVVPGETLFRHSMPADVSRGMMIRAPLSGVSVDPYMPGFYKPDIQIIVRHTDPEQGDKFAYQISRALTINAVETHPAIIDVRGQVRLSVFYPKVLPIQYPRLEGNGFEWSLNFVSAFSIQAL